MCRSPSQGVPKPGTWAGRRSLQAGTDNLPPRALCQIPNRCTLTRLLQRHRICEGVEPHQGVRRAERSSASGSLRAGSGTCPMLRPPDQVYGGDPRATRNLPSHSTCSRSVPGCEVLVVIDTRTSDATAAVAKDHGSRVRNLAWQGGFAAQRNRAARLFAGPIGYYFLMRTRRRLPGLVDEVKGLLASGHSSPPIVVPAQQSFGHWIEGWRMVARPPGSFDMTGSKPRTQARFMRRLISRRLRFGKLFRPLLHRTHTSLPGLMARVETSSHVGTRRGWEGW